MIPPLRLMNPFAVSVPAFKGYDARPLKTLYLQPTTGKAEIRLGKELEAIGKREGFDIVYQITKRLYEKARSLPGNWFGIGKSIFSDNPSIWSQDNKLFLKSPEGGEEVLVLPTLDFDIVSTFDNIAQGGVQDREEQEQAALLAKALKIPARKISSYLEGGNIFIGSKPVAPSASGPTTPRTTTVTGATVSRRPITPSKTEPYALLGTDSVTITARHLAGSDKAFRKSRTKFLKHARAIIAKDLKIAEKNLFVISQPEFHLDMMVRPLVYPYVLVNDMTLSVEALNETDLKDLPGKDLAGLEEIAENTQKYQRSLSRNGYASGKTVAEELKALGFKPIPVPGVFGKPRRGLSNYLNAVVHQRKTGELVYITNSSNQKGLNALFEAFLKTAAPQIKHVDFVSGGLMPGDERTPVETFLGTLLNEMDGGLHCIVSEQPA